MPRFDVNEIPALRDARRPFTLGDALTANRLMRGWSIVDIVQEFRRRGIKMSQKQCSDYERGIRTPPFATLMTMVEVLDGDGVTWCALAGYVHPRIRMALRDPQFATHVDELVGVWFADELPADRRTIRRRVDTNTDSC